MTASFIIGLLAGVIIGLTAAYVLLKVRGQSLLFLENKSRLKFAETVELLTKVIADKQWKVLFVHDLQETMLKNGHTVKSVKVLEICKPQYAVRVLGQSNERIASVMMPCRIAIYEKNDGQVYVSRMNSSLMSGLMKGEIPSAINPAAEETEQIVKSVL